MNSHPWKTLLVVITDPFAREQPALNKAAAISLSSGAELVLFNSFMLPQPVADVPMDSQPAIIASAIRQRRERMQALAAALGLHDAKCFVQWDYPAHEAIVRQALKTKPDLLLTSSHRHGRLARLLLANTDWELMRTCPCPVWFVRSAHVPQRPSVLIAVDPFHAHDKPARLDDRLIKAGVTLIRCFGGHMTLVHATDTAVDGLPVRSLVIAKAKQAVDDLAARHDVGPDYCEVRAGQPDEIISAFARREDADILVMGVVSRNASEHPRIGGTAERVIDRVDCDVLVVKPAGFKVPAMRTAAKTARGKGAHAVADHVS
jgi:universal stress protein E